MSKIPNHYGAPGSKKMGCLSKNDNPVLHARLALSKRDRNLAERYAEELRILGFTVVMVASRGVSFEGAVELFEEIFNCEVRSSENGFQFEGTPKLPSMVEEYVDSIYFPSRPSFFSS